MARSVAVALVAAALTVALAPMAQAASMPCASADEAHGFTLRHLQSRLMVAALSCNQRDAYNSFVTHFTDELAAGGHALIAYFRRTGGGDPALNKHVTDLANAAGLHLAHDQKSYCAAAWTTFLDLQQSPEQLAAIAEESLLPTIERPYDCAAITGPMTAPILTRTTGAEQEAKAPLR